jgi:hypothetical protein
MLLRAWLVDNGWQQCISYPCIYIFRAGHVFVMIALYVDDIPATCNDGLHRSRLNLVHGSKSRTWIKDHLRQVRHDRL